MRYFYQSFIAIAIFLFSISPKNSFAQLGINYGTPLVTGLANAVDITNAGDSRLFIAQQNGLIRIWNGTATLTTFMDLSGQGLFPNPLGGEQGLLSIAFHPGFATNRYFFIWYTASNGAVTLARYRANVGNATGDPASGVVLLNVAKPGTPYFTNHNGGKLNFGSDGKLYIGLGDGGDGGDPFGNAQNGNSLLGKMLRLDVDGFATSAPFYDIPADNPFLTPGDGIRDEIYALGLRNPWRWSFDRANGAMWIADVGQGLYEEVNYRTAANSAGVNYGWKCREGMHNYGSGCGAQTFTEPIFEYDHSTGGLSITGGYVYRGPDASNAPLLGRYITTDYITGNVWIIQSDGSFIKQTTNLVTNISSFGEGSDGALYAVRRAANGGLYKVNLLSVTPVTITNFTGEHSDNFNTLRWTTSSEQDITRYEIEFSNNGADFSNAGQQAANGSSGINNYSFQHNINTTSPVFYRLKIIGSNGGVQYSNVLRLAGTSDRDMLITPTYVTGRTVNIYSRVNLTKMQLITADGKIVFEKNMQQAAGSTVVNLPALPAGIYVVKLIGPDRSKTERIYLK